MDTAVFVLKLIVDATVALTVVPPVDDVAAYAENGSKTEHSTMLAPIVNFIVFPILLTQQPQTHLTEKY